MKLSVVIPTRGDQNMHNIIQCFETQTFEDFEVIFVVDKVIDSDAGRGTSIAEGKILDPHTSIREPITLENGATVRFITNLNSNFRPNNNASYIRNFGIDVAQGEFIQLMDDDEWFPENYLEKSLEERFYYRETIGRDFVLTPTLMYRKTGHIQNQGFSHFNYRLSRPIPKYLGHKKRDYIQMYSGNSLLAPARVFQKIHFDEKLDFVYEDLDFSYRIHKAGYPIIVLSDLKIYHMERDKTILEQARVGHELQAYKKSKHRIVFVKKHGNLIQKMQFYLIGLRAQPLRLLGKVLRHGEGMETWKIIRGMWRGFVDGMKW